MDRNRASWGKMCGNYKIYSPEEIETIKPDGILLTVYSNNLAMYESLKAELTERHPSIELLPNIFEEEIHFND